MQSDAVKRLMLLNCWISPLGVVLRERVDGVTLCLRVQDALGLCPTDLPVTTHSLEALTLLGFEDPAALIRDVSTVAMDRMICPRLCNSRFFMPALLQPSTQKFATTPLHVYVSSKHPGVKPGDLSMASITKLRDAMRAVIVDRYPDVREMAERVEAQNAVLVAVRAATLGLGKSWADGSDVAVVWRKFVKLRGLLPLSEMPPGEAREAWVAFRDDPARADGTRDWACMRHF